MIEVLVQLMDLIEENKRLILENKKLKKELALASHTETHLNSAENALKEKDGQIEALNKKIKIQEDVIIKLKNKQAIEETSNEPLKLQAERDVYYNALLDLEGSLVARAEHDKELAAQIRETLGK